MKIGDTQGVVGVSSAGPESPSQLPDRATFADQRIYPQVGQFHRVLEGRDGPLPLGDVAGRQIAIQRVSAGIQVSMESPAGKQIAVLSSGGELISSQGGAPNRLISTAYSLSCLRAT